ncbi:VWA domain-containing protein [Cellulosimicrobium cellulans]|uniref:VWA domain-containing protein n=1 Tax=Cellulosimicrobium cellulans TaxID=1710 RepID=UPI00130E3BFC|nr:VWA domain-containing protein [Cellulosimicrobium cellulans]
MDRCGLAWTGVGGAAALVALVAATIGIGMFLGRRHRDRRGAAAVVVAPLLVAALVVVALPEPAWSAVPDDCTTAAAVDGPEPGGTDQGGGSAGDQPGPGGDPLPLDPDDLTDSDGDGLPDVVEIRFGSDPHRVDTDGDGLTDAEEVATLTDPTRRDTDGNGVPDPDDDADGDGVSNRQELIDGTQPFNPDTDGDGATDGQERALGTDPLVPDTDGDGIRDGDEVRLGSDPLVPQDPGTVFALALTDPVSGAEAVVEGPAGAVLSARLGAIDAAEYEAVPGLVGTPVEIVADEPLVRGVLALVFDPASVAPDARLAVAHLDEEAGLWDLPADQEVDPAAGRAVVTTEAFSPFIIVDLDEFEPIWHSEVVLPRVGTDEVMAVDAVLALDSSGSMSSSDPGRARVTAAKAFVTALLDPDRVAVVDFDDAARLRQALTHDRAAAATAIDTTRASGGTNLAAAVRVSLNELDRGGEPDRDRVIVLLTDGVGTYDPALTTRAVESGTTIYTVGLGRSVDEALLQAIADATGGRFYWVDDAGLGGAYEHIGIDLSKPDSDGDGISDEAEINGWKTQRNNVYYTDPYNADTDGDGLTDGEEAGRLLSARQGYQGLSNPTKIDSDGDGLDDYTELEGGTNPLRADSDADDLSDLTETEVGSDPSSLNPDGDIFHDDVELARDSDPLAYTLGEFESHAALLGGFLFGEWDWGAEHVGMLNEDQQASVEYLTGLLAAGFLAVGDIRDAAAQIARGDWGGAILSVIGVVPALGDVAKSVAKVTRFAERSAKFARSAVSFVARAPDWLAGPCLTVLRKMPHARWEVDTRVTGMTPGRPSNGGQSVEVALNRLAAGRLRIGTSANQHRRLGELITKYCKGEIRINQWQVTGRSGNLRYAGKNRPDLQCLTEAKTWFFAELDSPASGRGAGHRVRILLNDPSLSPSQVLLEVVS